MSDVDKAFSIEPAGYLYRTRPNEFNDYKSKVCFSFDEPVGADYVRPVYTRDLQKRVWRHISTFNYVHAHRTGWRGVWDAIKAAITGDPRLSMPQQRTTEMWIQLVQDEQLVACGTQNGLADGFVDGVMKK